MAHNRIHAVWTWLDEDGDPIYVGWGKHENSHPAKKQWAMRKAFPSELNRWLVTLDSEPERDNVTTDILMQRKEASGMAVALRKRHQKNGIKLLDSRPEGTRLGGGSCRRVLSPDFEIYESVRQAATAVGVHASTITRWCDQVDSQWDRLPQQERGTDEDHI